MIRYYSLVPWLACSLSVRLLLFPRKRYPSNLDKLTILMGLNKDNNDNSTDAPGGVQRASKAAGHGTKATTSSTPRAVAKTECQGHCSKKESAACAFSRVNPMRILDGSSDFSSRGCFAHSRSVRPSTWK